MGQFLPPRRKASQFNAEAQRLSADMNRKGAKIAKTSQY